MTNIRNYNFSGIDFRIDYSEYYDFYLNTDGYSFDNESSFGDWHEIDFDNDDWHTSSTVADDFLISSFNFNYYLDGDLINSLTSIDVWEDAISSELSATTYGLTGLDNGAIFYDVKTNSLINTLTGSTLIKSSSDTALLVNQVSGYTGNYVYPLELISTTDSTGNYVDFCGGFYQGFYKLDGYQYQVLPTRYQKGWTVETWLRKSDSVCSGTTGTILNDTYPNNKGFFYFNGLRAENKFWNIFTGNTIGDCDFRIPDFDFDDFNFDDFDTDERLFCTEVKEIDVNINNINIDGSGSTVSVPLSPPPIDVEIIKNQFLIFGRSNGLLCSNEQSGDGYGQVRADRNYNRNQVYYSQIIRTVQTDFTNPFLVFGRSNGLLCNNEQSGDGYGQVRAGRDYVSTTVPLTELDKDKDIIGNALGFRIKDDGSIGYRMLVLSADCKSVEMIEEFSISGMVTDDQWQHIVVKWVNNDTYSECDLINGKTRRGRFKFYVNSFLIFTSKELDEFIPRRIDDFMEKQIGVPYNVSIGGGTQGLIESLTFDGQDPNDLGLIIEENFAGSFIGSMSSFNIYDNGLSWCTIKELYKDNLVKYI